MKPLSTLNGLAKRLGKTVRAKSPEILIMTAAVGTVAGVVTAIIATTKAPEVVKEHCERIEHIHDVSNDIPMETEAKKAIAKTYLRTGMKLAALYAPTIVLTATSIGCMFLSNRKARERTVAIGAAYTALDTAFKSYRDRVIERFGEKVDEELRLGIHEEEVTETVVDENGKKKKVKSTVLVTDTDPQNPYRRVFDESNINWVGRTSSNLIFIRGVERTYNDILRVHKKVFLNEVLDALGFPKTQMGQIVGWRYDPDNNENGDNHISFSLFDCRDRTCRDASDFDKNIIVIEFNVDGPIIDYLPEM